MLTSLRHRLAPTRQRLRRWASTAVKRRELMPRPRSVLVRRYLALWAGVLAVIAVSALRSPSAAPQNPPPSPAPAVASPHGALEVACEQCHTAAGWTAMRPTLLFDHGSTGFPLDGQHRKVGCKRCHTSLVFSRVATSCADCHRDVHEGRNGLRCQDCHATERWVGRSDAVRQHAATGFPLRGVHGLLECTRCHAAPGEASVAKLSSDCVSCHAEDYAATTAPNHTVAGFPTRCEECHDASRTTWSGSGFDHGTTGFALTGAHRPLVCTRCHAAGSYAGLTADCVSCHRTDYDATTNPGHAAANFPLACASCHTTSAWQPASFDHNATSFALTGAHRSVACASCHVGGQYAGTPADCAACHRDDYDATTNPNHAAASFSTACTPCHSTNAWRPATFDHDGLYFRIYSGKHAGRWSSCSICHANPSSYADFTCLQCHEHSQTAMDDKHRERPGYIYESNACYSCHRGA